MGAYDEIVATGKLGADGVVQLYRTVGAVARRRGYPPPPGHSAWTSEAVMEEAHDFLTAKRSKSRLLQLHIKATNEDSFAALLHVAVLNHFRSRARMTATGRLVRRLNELLAEDNRFERLAGDRWQLVGANDADIPMLRDQELEAAAWQTSVDIVRYRPDAKHQSSGAGSNDLKRLVEAVLTAAAAPVEVGRLAKILGARLGLRELPVATAVSADDLHDEFEPVAPDDSHTAAVAAGVWSELDADERRVLAGYDLTVEELADLIETSQSTAHRARKRLEEALRAKFVDIDDGDEVWRALRLLAERLRDGILRERQDDGTR